MTKPEIVAPPQVPQHVIDDIVNHGGDRLVQLFDDVIDYGGPVAGYRFGVETIHKLMGAFPLYAMHPAEVGISEHSSILHHLLVIAMVYFKNHGHPELDTVIERLKDIKQPRMQNEEILRFLAGVKL